MKAKAKKSLYLTRPTNPEYLLAGNVEEAKHFLKRAMNWLFATGANVLSAEYEAAFVLADCVDLIAAEQKQQRAVYFASLVANGPVVQHASQMIQ